MVRIRCPGGAITPRQLRAVAELAQSYAAASLHITTRQELQLHDIALENVIPILRRLHHNRLSTRGGGGNTVRNIIAPPDSGVAANEVFDVDPYVFALTGRLVDESDSWLLPRKYKIAFSNTANDGARAVFNDLGFIAAQRDGKRGFAVYVAGGLGSKPQAGHLLHEFVADTEVYFIAEAVKQLFNKHGNRKNRHAARLRFLWNHLGEKHFIQLYQQELDGIHRQPVEPLRLPPPLSKPVPVPDASVHSLPADFQAWRRRFVAQQKQPGLFTIGVPVRLGSLPHADAMALADFLIPLGEDVFARRSGRICNCGTFPKPRSVKSTNCFSPFHRWPRSRGYWDRSSLAPAPRHANWASACRVGRWGNRRKTRQRRSRFGSARRRADPSLGLFQRLRRPHGGRSRLFRTSRPRRPIALSRL